MLYEQDYLSRERVVNGETPGCDWQMKLGVRCALECAPSFEGRWKFDDEAFGADGYGFAGLAYA
jgi:hypothetical protein